MQIPNIGPIPHDAHLVIMGASGCGKTTLGRKVAGKWKREFIEGDDFHFPKSFEKMKQGIPLTDEDRLPWLDRLVQILDDSNKSVVLACSALKRSYRDRLRNAKRRVLFLHLKVSRKILFERLQNRKEHFFSPSLLDDQLCQLEDLHSDELGITVNHQCKPEEWIR
jgi:gluconokinase